MAVAFELPSSRFTVRLLATRGNRLALHLTCLQASEGDGGPIELEFLQVTEVDAEEVGPSLRWATAKVARTNGTSRKASGQVNQDAPF